MKHNCAYTDLVELHKLQENPKNPNKHPDRQIELLAKIIDYQGQRAPIVVSKRSGFITKGHGRLMALQKLGWEKAAVDYQDYESEAQEYADLIADNKIAELAQHDDAKMIEDLKLIDLDDFELLGLDDFELPNEPDPAKEEIEDEIPDNVETRCKPGDLWILGEHRLLCGDSTNIQHVERLMGGEKADMVFTDPPYKVISGGSKSKRDVWEGTALEKNDGKIFKHNDLDIKDLMPILEIFSVENCQMYIMVNFLNLRNYLNVISENFSIHNLLIWKKKNGLPSQYYCKNIEYTIFFRKGKAFPINNLGSQICEEFKHDADKVHPTQKPVSLVEFYVENSSKSKQNVFEPFGGSGSTLIACEKTNRKCFMSELDPHYCDVILTRWEQYSGKSAILQENQGE